ncbi:MAG: response regulator [Hyphomicrobiaceae bacterium]|jgi:two-component system chemotaxis response regulator CheY|nr:response regulator [Hyphomicrobiaceae bacterium]
MTTASDLPILVVDDYSTMVRIMKKLLKEVGFDNVDDANSGTAALEMMSTKKYGLIISDWNMEPMTGFELLQKVRADEATKTLPFIMVTAESKQDNVKAAKQAGVNNYLIKPFNAAVLKVKIEQALTEAAAMA